MSDDLAGGPPDVHYLPHHGVHRHYLLFFHSGADIPIQSVMSHIVLKFSQNVSMGKNVKQNLFEFLNLSYFSNIAEQNFSSYSFVGLRFNLSASIKTPSHSSMTLINVAFLII